ncbi:MAG: MoaD/ThiS family protein [Candidatus Hodarchaeota archaeon]
MSKSIAKRIVLEESGETVEELIARLELDGKYMVVLVNGRRADKDLVLKETDEIIILPRLVGG